ncbi:MAG: glycosyltransferase family 2 protein [Deltaproteobacteria bacterium]|nr:glycosyltransferase family 2 protein [Deltaproteobacteria bacterium]
MNEAKISAFIVCWNEERNIRRCLESVKWCDEIVIVDSGSTDATLQICKEYTDQITHRPWSGYVEQKRFALSLCSHDWALNIDADEEVSPELMTEIRSTLNSAQSSQVNGYALSRVVYYLGKWWRKGGWYPEYRLRLCRKNRTTWGGTDPHEKAIVEGATAKLSGELRHYTYTGVADQISRLNRYSTTIAENLYRSGERSSAIKIFLNPVSRFFKFYILKKGFREGLPGLIVACIEAYYAFLKYVKLWELERSKNKSNHSA